MFGVNPIIMLVAAGVALGALTGAYVKGRADGGAIVKAKCTAEIAVLNDEIAYANEKIRAAEQAQRDRFSALLEERRKTSEQMADVKARSDAELQQRMAEYEIELSSRDGCLLTADDIDRMRNPRPETAGAPDG